jgi:hypothetical protein
MFTFGKTCPRCRLKTLCPSSRKPGDRILSLIGLKPLRCISCHRRFYAPRALAPSRPRIGLTQINW